MNHKMILLLLRHHPRLRKADLIEISGIIIRLRYAKHRICLKCLKKEDCGKYDDDDDEVEKEVGDDRNVWEMGSIRRRKKIKSEIRRAYNNSVFSLQFL